MQCPVLAWLATLTHNGLLLLLVIVHLKQLLLNPSVHWAQQLDIGSCSPWGLQDQNHLQKSLSSGFAARARLSLPQLN